MKDIKSLYIDYRYGDDTNLGAKLGLFLAATLAKKTPHYRTSTNEVISSTDLMVVSEALLKDKELGHSLASHHLAVYMNYKEILCAWGVYTLLFIDPTLTNISIQDFVRCCSFLLGTNYTEVVQLEDTTTDILRRFYSKLISCDRHVLGQVIFDAMERIDNLDQRKCFHLVKLYTSNELKGLRNQIIQKLSQNNPSVETSSTTGGV